MNMRMYMCSIDGMGTLWEATHAYGQTSMGNLKNWRTAWERFANLWEDKVLYGKALGWVWEEFLFMVQK